MNAYVVLNTGSSSIRFSVYPAPSGAPLCLIRGQVEGLGAHPRFIASDGSGTKVGEQDWGANDAVSHEQALGTVLTFIQDRLRGVTIEGIGHRVVHGGATFSGPIRIDRDVLEKLTALIPLAPLHQPHNLAAIRQLMERMADIPQVACFDTAFHHAQPRLAQMFALPPELESAGVRRYGFHGLSYEYIAEALRSLDPAAGSGRVIVLHLGSGASMCAIAAGRSVASTMGFSTVDGLPMGTRAGTLDPGALLYLMNERGMDARAIERLIYYQSGLLGVSGISGDMRLLEASNKPRAKLAIDLFVYRIGRELGSLAAALGGLDALVFTAGIGENSILVRERVCRDAAWLGLELDPEANTKHGPRISNSSSRVGAWVIPTDEERVILRHMRRLLNS